MKAVIMAGGEGTRLRPLTSNQPKPMVPMVNRPLMEYIVLLLKKHGMTDTLRMDRAEVWWADLPQPLGRRPLRPGPSLVSDETRRTLSCLFLRSPL